ncbi:unnamed protein product [Polarella glacialis]|uniref:MYND-type domain-containing protein n=1 Tax=Polarella glacialis TaxID=89957 RepID=A0A813HAD4_POLGL|nr:unnamed protein product [Polarella glacialis]CAE8634621.1 unnamed protein product [Polarella glacialis]
MTGSLGTCRVCSQREALALCSRCREVGYCGPDCQREDWPSHKASCNQATKLLGKPTGPVAATPSPVQCETGGLHVVSPSKSLSGTPGTPAGFDVVLHGQRSIENAQMVIDKLKERGVCVVKAGADRSFQRAVHMESEALRSSRKFGEAKKGQPVVPGSDQIRFDARDDKVVWLSSSWIEANEKKARALKVLDDQLADFGWGLKQMLEDQLGLTLSKRSPGMLSCYDGGAVPGAKYDFHIDNPYQTQMEVPDDGRRLTLIYYISDGQWDVQKDGGGLQVCLSDPRRAPRTTAEAKTSELLTVAPECDTIVAFFSHTMYHAVLPLSSSRRRFALSTWFSCK